MKIDQDKLLRGLAHEFLVIRTPYAHKLTDLETDSVVFYTCNGLLGELLFLPVGVMTEDRMIRIKSGDILHTSDLDQCRGRFLDRKYMTEELRRFAEKTEKRFEVDEDTKYLRTNGSLDPYRLKTYRDIITVYDTVQEKHVQVLPLKEGVTKIYALRRVYRKDGKIWFGEGVYLKMDKSYNI